MAFSVHEHCKKMATQEDGTPWWAAFPEPKARCESVEASEVADLVEKQTAGGPRDFLLVDVRRTDWTGGTVTSSINLPAHSFYPTRGIIYDLCKQAGIKRVIFYCGQNAISRSREASSPADGVLGSSNGRAPRCAGWLQDYSNQVGGDVQALTMKGGIRGFVKSYGGRLMDGYDEKAWEDS